MDLLSHSSVRQTSALLAEHSSRPLPQGQIQGSSWPGLLPGGFGTGCFRHHSECWKNLTLSSCIAGVWFALLPVTWGSYLYFRDYSVFSLSVSHLLILPWFSLVFSQTTFLSIQKIRLGKAGWCQTFPPFPWLLYQWHLKAISGISTCILFD